MPRTPDYRADDLVAQPGTDPYLRPAFSFSNRLARFIWSCVWLCCYRFSPRPFHFWRAFLLRLFGAKLGPHCHFYPSSKVWAPWNLHCADHVSAGDAAEIYNPAPVQLDSHVILSQGSYLCGATHDYNDPSFPLLAYRMHIEQHAWICARAIVAPGVHIAAGAVLGIGAVAVKDLAPWTVYSGNPAQPLRERTRPTS
jgi:putative colanic acid biosynthesis acetyltransferase WcaF